MRSRLLCGLGLVSLLVSSACALDEDPPVQWSLEREESAGALMSVWGSGPNDVWAAGGQVGQGLVLHNDGSGFREMKTGADQLLNWVYGFHASDVYAVGEHGLILHYDGNGWQRAPSVTTQTLYGVWGASGDEVWIVGGDPTGDAGSAVVLRGHGTDFEKVADVPRELLPSALYKVYGGPQGLIAVGSRGTVLRYDGVVWSQDVVPTDESLFSLWGRSTSDLYAVGGSSTGTLLHYDGQSWSQVMGAELPNGLSGVFTAPDLPTIAVGADALVLELEAGADDRDASDAAYFPLLPRDSQRSALHGVWGDGEGRTYAVGGTLGAYPGPMAGVIFVRE